MMPEQSQHDSERRPSRARRFCARVALLVALFGAVGADAYGQSTAWWIGARFDELTPGGGGGGLSLDWVGERESGVTTNVGADYNELAGSRWAYASLGGAWRRGRRLIPHAGIDLGGGRLDDDGFGYRVARGGLTRETVARRLWLEIEDQDYDIGDITTNVLVVGATASLTPRVVGSLRYFFAIAGDEVEMTSARLDLSGRRGDYFLGATVGESAADLAARAAVGAGVPTVDEVFVGVLLPQARRQLVVTLGFLDTGEVERLTLTLALRLPGRRTAPAEPVQPGAPPGR